MRFRLWPFGTNKGETADGGEKLVCPKCGMVIPAKDITCPQCGEKLEPAAEEKLKSDKREKPQSLKRSLLLFGRDVLFAFLVVGIVIAGIYAYTRVWPPMVVVESGSMQHSSTESQIGVIDTGDLVLVQAAPQRSDVITWVEGRSRGYSTYGNYGDVIIFNTPDGGTPIIHRPILWLDYDKANNKFNASDLEGLDHSLWGGTYANGTPVTTPYDLDHELWISEAGWRGNLLLSIDIATKFIGSSENHHSGYVTLGDNNLVRYDSDLVRQEDIVGRARGELPWFGLIKLTIAPTPGKCCRQWGDPAAPRNSWDSLLISLSLMIAAPIIYEVSSALWNRWKKTREAKQQPRLAETSMTGGSSVSGGMEEKGANSSPPTGDRLIALAQSDKEVDDAARPEKKEEAKETGESRTGGQDPSV